ncbi:MAG: SIMPL domain-containing protein [Saprospiraceae bacterium]|nr:SIMPL domain-containing protein [Saprospiraceae bacterium]
MEKRLIVMSFALMCSLPSYTQVMGNYAEQQQTYQNVQFNAQFRAVPKSAELVDNNVIQLGINALLNKEADNYTAIFSCMQSGKTAEETDNLLSARINGLLADLQMLGIPRSDIYVDMVNFLPRYEYDVNKKLFSKKTYTEIPKGFELQKNIHVRYADPALLDRIVTAAAKQEIYDIVKVDYFVRDPQSVYAQLRAATFAYLNDVEKAYKNIGIEFDSAYMITAENAWVAYPINRYESYRAFSTQSLDLEKTDKGVVVNSADKPVARFYNAVPANDYDVVINPEILEPAVQFSYNLIVRYTLPERKVERPAKPVKELFLIAPNGELKPIKLD